MCLVAPVQPTHIVLLQNFDLLSQTDLFFVSSIIKNIQNNQGIVSRILSPVHSLKTDKKAEDIASLI